MKIVLTGLAFSVLLAGCSSSSEEPKAKQTQNQELYKAVNAPLEKAKGAEQQIFDGAAEQQKQAENL